MREQELKPCPFCGHPEIDPAEWMGEGGKTGPGCPKCGCIAESVEAWNRRAPSVQEGVRGALEALDAAAESLQGVQNPYNPMPRIELGKRCQKAADTLRATLPPASTEGGATPYDRAVAALAPYLPDGWVAQDEDGEVYWFSERPKVSNVCWAFGGPTIRRFAPITCRHSDWKASLRRISAGRVVEGGEG
jgi:hypothetical protein